MNRWVDRVALVTGASSVIGATICRELLKHGMTVVACTRNINNINISEEEVSQYAGKLHAIRCDMTVESDILAMHQEIKEKYGRLDVCINNAMSLRDGSLLSGKTEDWRYQLDLNIIGRCINIRESIKLMKEKNIDDGHIIHMGSIIGHKLPTYERPSGNLTTQWFSIYNSMMWMIRALAESLRQEIRSMDKQIKVSVISPGVVQPSLPAEGTSTETAENPFKNKKLVEPKDVAEAVIYVLSTQPHVNVHDVLVECLDHQIY